MALTYENSPLSWGNNGTVPSEESKKNGYTAGEKLPASHLNYLIKNKELVEKELQTKLSDLHTTVDTKVDKVSGKGLSTNDYTTAEKNKLAGIATGATANVVENVLTSTSTTNALSAAQGKALNDTKLPLAGGTITGNLTVNGTFTNTALNTTIANKVDKVSGKQLSTNDYTTAEKTKLTNIAEGANKTVVENVLTSTSTTNALSAAQGKALNDSKVDKVSGKQLSTNDYTTEEKNKLANIATGATANVVENVLTSTSTANALSAAQGKILNDNKVDKVSGKGLSTNDYTTTEKDKLAGIATGATANVVENVLTSTSTTNALSAAQGKALNDSIGGLSKKYKVIDATATDIVASTDLNTIVTIGNYRCSATATAQTLTNKPTDLTVAFVMTVGCATGSTSYLYQEIISYDTGTRWYRMYTVSGSSWTAWNKTLNTVSAVPVANGGTGANTAANARANLGAVSKAGDTITGALTVQGGVIGNVTGAVTGNASTATKLQTARTINGVSFDGSSNITVADSTKLPLSGGTITGNLTVGGATTTTGALTAKGGVVGNVTGAVTGNASTATKLQTARTINGVSFDGSANITVADNTKLPLAGGTITGNLTVNGTFTNTALNNTIANKVDKVSGKQLSTNDYTTAEKNKLAGIAAGANSTVVENVLTSTNGATALSANMGRTLNDTKWHYHGVKGDVDLDTLTTTGNYYITSFLGTAGINYPVQVGVNSAWLEVCSEFGNRIIQKVHITKQWGDMAVFERWWADGTWRPWSQISTGSIDLTNEFNTDVVNTIQQMTSIQNGKFNVCRDFNTLSSMLKENAKFIMPAPLVNEGARVWFNFTHHGINERNKHFSLDGTRSSTEYWLEVWSTSHPDRKYQLFKPYGRTIAEVRNDWYVCNFSTV